MTPLAHREQQLRGAWPAMRRLAFWPLLVLGCLWIGRTFAHRPLLVTMTVAAAALAVLVILFPRPALLIALMTVPLAFLKVPRVGVPLNEVMIAAAIAGLAANAAMHRGRYLRPGPRWLLPALVAAAAILLISMVANGAYSGQALKRMGHIAIVFVLVWVLASGAVEMRSAARAMIAGMLIAGLAGLVFFAIGYTPDQSYGGRLTGLFGDPNVAGFYIVVLGTISWSYLSTRGGRYLAIASLGTLLVLTLSRTSLIAAAAVVVWIVASRRDRLWLGITTILVLAAVVAALPTVKSGGVFRSRSGSDSLRTALLQQTEKKALASPLLGSGPSPQRVEVRGIRLLPHNSYLALIAEGGVFFAFVWLVALISTLSLLARMRPRSPPLEASLIAVLVIALGLGEVLLEIPAMVALGVAASYVLRMREELPASRASDVPSPREPVPVALTA